MKQSKKSIKNISHRWTGPTSSPEHSTKIILLTAHAGPGNDFLVNMASRPHLEYFSSSPGAYTEKYICMACYVTTEKTGQQLKLFGDDGLNDTGVPGWKFQNPQKLYQSTARSTVQSTLTMKPTSSYDGHSVDPDPDGEWYEWDGPIAIPK